MNTFFIDTFSRGTYDSKDFKEIPMHSILMLLLAVVLLAPAAAAQNRPAKTLYIYVIDIEGGNSQLYVSPSGACVLIHTGTAGAAAARAAHRTAAAARPPGP